jgi:hypothetical protein
VLVDLTVAKDMQGKGYAKELLDKNLGGLKLEREIRNLFTYSPETAVGLHERYGAKPVRRIENARPMYRTPNTVIMEHPIERKKSQSRF